MSPLKAQDNDALHACCLFKKGGNHGLHPGDQMTRHRFSSIGIALLTLIIPSAHAANSAPIRCPAEISPGDVTIAARAGWQTHVPYSLPLYGAGMPAGPPESETVLRGEPLDARGNSTAYHFGGPDDERWLDCSYGRSGEFTMSRRLDNGIRRCVIKLHQRVAGNPRRVDIRCI